MKNIAFIFDFDGTIADTFTEFVRIYNTLADTFKINKIKDSDLPRFKNMTSHQIATYLEIPMRKIPAILLEGRKLFYNSSRNIKPHEGLKDMLEKLKATGARIGILTSNSKENVVKFLEEHQIDCFEFICSSSKLWGKNRPLKSLLANQSLAPQHVLYIGDETRDIEAAKKVGIQAAAVTWGYNSSEILKDHDPDYLINHPEELIQIYKDFV